jgi:hypothetical protein
LTFDWSNYEFLSYLENSVALNHIRKDHTLLRKLSHTHTHIALVKFTIEKFLSAGKFLCLLALNSQLYLGIFLNWFISYLYMHVLKLTLGKIFFCKFSSSFSFHVWNVWTDLLLCPDAYGFYVQMMLCYVWTHEFFFFFSKCCSYNRRPDRLVFRLDGIFYG